MPKLSAGILVYRQADGVTEVLLVHPGGPFWAKKDNGAWSLPKGEYLPDENPQAAAKREFKEETGLAPPDGEYIELGEVKYNNKLLTAWGVKGLYDLSSVRSNYFEVEWPPRSGKIQQFPEVDRAGWFSLSVAKRKLVPGQVLLIDVLAEKLGQAVEGDYEARQPTLF